MIKKYNCNKNVTFLRILFPAPSDPSIHFPQQYICFSAQTCGPEVDFLSMEKTKYSSIESKHILFATCLTYLHMPTPITPAMGRSESLQRNLFFQKTQPSSNCGFVGITLSQELTESEPKAKSKHSFCLHSSLSSSCLLHTLAQVRSNNVSSQNNCYLVLKKNQEALAVLIHNAKCWFTTQSDKDRKWNQEEIMKSAVSMA